MALDFNLLLCGELSSPSQPKAGGTEDQPFTTSPPHRGGNSGVSPPLPHLRLHHGRPLGPQHLHRLEDVHYAFVPHPLQHDAERDEDAGPAHAGAVGGRAAQGQGCWAPSSPGVELAQTGPPEADRYPPRASASLAGKWAGARGAAHLQWTEMGPSWPNCSLVLCTWPMKSMKPSPDLGTPCSGQSVNWNCRTVRDWPSWKGEEPHLATEVHGGRFPVPSSTLPRPP